MSNIRNDKVKQIINIEGNFAKAAKLYLEIGFRPVPICLKTSRQTVDIYDWISGGVTADSIDKHFSEHPDDVIGIHLGNSLMSIQASSEEAIDCLCKIEKEHLAAPKMIIQTPEGECHYFQTEKGVSFSDAFGRMKRFMSGMNSP